MPLLFSVEGPGPMSALPNPDYELDPRCQGFRDAVDDKLRRTALVKFLPAFQEAYQRYLSAPRPDYEVRIGDGDELLRRLQESGCATTPIGAELKDRLVGLTWAAARKVSKTLQWIEHPKFKHSQFHFDRSEHAELFELVEEILEREHIYAVASAYAGRPLALHELTVQVNTERVTAHEYGVLDAEGLPSPRTRYMHIDSAIWPPVKVLIYLSKVTPDQGPFRYVEGSHRLASDFELMVRKVNDRETIKEALLMALPPQFRMHTLFGDLLDPESTDARRLLARERAYSGEAGSLILFDFNGVHRGGFVRQGYRHMLQCHFTGRD